MSHLIQPVTYDRLAAIQAVLWMAGIVLGAFLLLVLWVAVKSAIDRPHRAWRKK